MDAVESRIHGFVSYMPQGVYEAYHGAYWRTKPLP